MTDFVSIVEGAALSETTKFIVRRAAEGLSGLFQSLLQRRRARAEEARNPERLRLEESRLKETFAAARSTLRDAVASQGFDAERFEREVSEPAFAQFLEDAMGAAAASTVASKRLLLGEMIAKRLQLQTDDSDEVRLRRALNIVKDINEPQILLLAAILIVNNPSAISPAPNTFGSREGAEMWLQERFGTLVANLNQITWTAEDFELLSALGALRLPESLITGIERDHADAIEQWLVQHDVSVYDFGPDIEPFNPEHRTAMRNRFPTLIGLKQMNEKAAPYLEDVTLSPIGDEIARLVLERNYLLPRTMR